MRRIALSIAAVIATTGLALAQNPNETKAPDNPPAAPGSPANPDTNGDKPAAPAAGEMSGGATAKPDAPQPDAAPKSDAATAAPDADKKAAPAAPAADAAAPAGDGPKVTLAKAIETAEQKGAGKATEVEFDDDKGGRWDVKVLSAKGDKLVEYEIDATSGQVVGEEEQTIEIYFTTLKPDNFAKAAVQLKDAVKAAEEKAGGTATSAEVEKSGDAVAYEVEVKTADGKTKKVDVDAKGETKMD